MLIFAIWGALLGTLGLVMAFARTSPDEARSKLSEWADFFGLKRAARWLGAHAIDRRVSRYGKWLVFILLFVGGMILQSWLKVPLVSGVVPLGQESKEKPIMVLWPGRVVCDDAHALSITYDEASTPPFVFNCIRRPN